jgi:hypothetical protein
MGLLAAELGDDELFVDGSRYQSRRRIATAPDICLPAWVGVLCGRREERTDGPESSSVASNLSRHGITLV